MSQNRASSWHSSLLWVLLVFVFIYSAVIRAPHPDSENWRNSDATYHALLTIHAYNETPISEHKFVPIVSLGHPEDKLIPWGATIASLNGNQVYTSFSSLGFALPYVALKAMAIPASELGIFIFNTLVFLTSWLLLTFLLVVNFKTSSTKVMVISISSLIYLFSFETMHAQGVAYWAQSIFQPILFLQCITFLKMKDSVLMTILFIVLFFLAPLVEWTGFVSGVGFVIAYGWRGKVFQVHKMNWKVNYPILWGCVGLLAILPLSILAYYYHFSTVLQPSDFLSALHARFLARSHSDSGTNILLLKGYIRSFGSILAVTFILVVVTLSSKRLRPLFLSGIRSNYMLGIILCFPILENIIMKQHAISYSFDRMKLVLPIIFINLLILMTFESGFPKKKRWIQGAFLFLLIVISAANLCYYRLTNNYYRWKTEPYTSNIVFRDYINAHFDRSNSILGQKFEVRGYTNLLFNRGIYEYFDKESIQELSRKKGKRYAVFLECEPEESQKYHYSRIQIFDLNDSIQVSVHLENGRIIEETIKLN